MDYLDIYDKYKKTAIAYIKRNKLSELNNLSEADMNHVIDLATGVMLCRDEIRNGGSFVESVVANDLEGAINRADTVALKALKMLVLVKLWCHCTTTYELN
jgi:hypothetical protein